MQSIKELREKLNRARHAFYVAAKAFGSLSPKAKKEREIMMACKRKLDGSELRDHPERYGITE